MHPPYGAQKISWYTAWGITMVAVSSPRVAGPLIRRHVVSQSVFSRHGGAEEGKLSKNNVPKMRRVTGVARTLSCPPERLFSMFNATFGEDQKSSFGDYLELAMQSQSCADLSSKNQIRVRLRHVCRFWLVQYNSVKWEPSKWKPS